MLPPVKIGSVSEPPTVQFDRKLDHEGKIPDGYATRPNADESDSDGIRSACATVTALFCAVTFSAACRTGARLAAAVSGASASKVEMVPGCAAEESSSDVVSASESVSGRCNSCLSRTYATSRSERLWMSTVT